MDYTASPNRYNDMIYRYCGQSGLLLPVISLGLWHNFGDECSYNHTEKLIHQAFDKGVTHFDLADNYGVPAGSAELSFGKVLKNGFSKYRDELIVTTKAGHDMWQGPYGSWGSRKHLIAGLDQSLKRMGLDYVDIFYTHRPDPETPIQETAEALAQIVRSGKALYIGISKYNKDQTAAISKILHQEQIPYICYQGRYSMLVRDVERDILSQAAQQGLGFVAFSPLAQGLLTSRYQDGIPRDSRAAKGNFLKTSDIKPEIIERVKALQCIADSRNQTLAQMSLAWLLKDNRVTSVICGASSMSQLNENIDTIKNIEFTAEELQSIEAILSTRY